MKPKSFLSEIKPLFGISQLEVVVYVVLLLAISMGVITTALNIDSFVENEFNDFQKSSSTYEQYQSIANQVNTNEYVANGVVFTVWAISGLIMFNTFLLLWSSERSIVELVRLMARHTTESRNLLEERAIQIVLRVSAVIWLIILAMVAASLLFPLILLLLNSDRLNGPLDYALTIAGVWGVIVVISHLIIVALRFLVLRRRLIL